MKLRKILNLFLVVFLIAAVFSGCSKNVEDKTENNQQNNVDVTQKQVTETEVTEEAITDWVDENQDVDIGDMI